MVILSAITTLFIAIQDPITQKFAARIAGGYLSEKTGAEIKIGKLYISPDFAIHLEDFYVKDLNDNYLAKIGMFHARIVVQDLLNGKIHLKRVDLKDTEANIIQYEGEDEFNFAFIVNAFQTDTVKEKSTEPFNLRIDHVNLKNIDFMLWNQDRTDLQKTLDNRMDYAHLDLDDISLEADNITIIDDSIHADIKSLMAKELSGFEIKSFQGIANVSPSGILVDSLYIQTNNSNLHLDLHMLYSDYSDINSFVDSVYFDSRIYPTDIMLSDIGVFAEVMYKMPDLVHFETRFIGPIEHFRVEDLKAGFGNETYFEGNMSMHPLDFFYGQHTLNINKMHYSYDDLVHFYIPGSTETIPIPESLKGLDKGNIRFNFKGSYKDFLADANITSGIGNVAANFNMDLQGAQGTAFSGKVKAQRIDIGTLANASNIIGSIDVDAEIAGRVKPKGNMEFDIKGDAYNAYILDNTIDKIKLNGRLTDKRFNGKISIKDNELDLDFNGLADFNNPKMPHGDFSATINKADLIGLNVIKNDSIALVSTKITANMVGFDPDKMEGSLSIDNTHFINGLGHFEMQHLEANIENDKLMQRRININCDFFNYEMAGLIDFASLPIAFKTYLDTYADIPKWHEDIQKNHDKKNKKEQDFFIKMNITNPDPITEMLLPQLKIAKNTTLNGTFTSRTNMLSMTLRSKSAKYNDIMIDNFEYKHYTTLRSSVARFSIDEIVLRDSTRYDSSKINLENVVFENALRNDSIFANLRWDDGEAEPHNRANINTLFVPTGTGGRFNIYSTDLLINDSIWSIDSMNYIVFDDDRINIQNLGIYHNKQHFSIDGYVPFNETDTINAKFDDFDLSTFDLIFKGFGLDLDGYIDGDAQVSDIKGNPMILANLDINRFGLNGEPIGNLSIDSYWDNPNNSVFLKTEIINNDKSTLELSGFYHTQSKEDNLNFDLKLDSLDLDFLSDFTQGIVSRLQGFGNGDFSIQGTFNKPVIEGELTIDDGGCMVDFLKTYYTFNPTLKLTNNQIEFTDMVLTDTLGNSAKVIGNIKHNYLKDFNIGLTLLPVNFLAMATTFKDSPSYYGTAIASGIVKVDGPLNNIKLKINALTRQGTKITIPFNNSSSVKDNDFITFVPPKNAYSEEETEIAPKKIKSNFDLNLDLNVTNDAKLKILLPSDIGSLDAAGSGNIKIGTNSVGEFTLFGDYLIDNGKLQINYNNIISKNLKLEKGGTISWTGDPTKGIINVTGIYSTTTTLSSLGVLVDSTSSNFNNVNVECLIHLRNALMNPNVSFSIRIPNASEDTKQSVFAILDTTNQSAMTQQAISLLVLNSFSNTQAASSFSNSSVYLDVLTNQLTNWVSQISQNFDMGIHYKPGDALSNEELQIALKTQLFNDRLSIETNFGMINNANSTASNASNLVGEFDINWKISKDGKLQAHLYNHSNSNNYYYNYTFDKPAPYTQGLGLSYSHSFNRIQDIFKKKRTLIPERPNNVKPDTTKQ